MIRRWRDSEIFCFRTTMIVSQPHPKISQQARTALALRDQIQMRIASLFRLPQFLVGLDLRGHPWPSGSQSYRVGADAPSTSVVHKRSCATFMSTTTTKKLSRPIRMYASHAPTTLKARRALVSPLRVRLRLARSRLSVGRVI